MHDHQKDSLRSLDFDAIRLKLASPDDIHGWSHGEVTRPETINYRTQRPEKDGLFSERIFGPQKDWECYCGKYKKIRYKGIVCDKCGVEVTRSVVRRERMGHIDLCSPVAHIWFLRGVPSKIGLLLDISIQNLERIIYFASFIITSVNEEMKAEVIEQLSQEAKNKKRQIEDKINHQANEIRAVIAASGASEEEQDKQVAKQIGDLNVLKLQQIAALDDRVRHEEEELKDLKPLKIIGENAYRELSLKYGHIFEASIGAESIRKLLERMDLNEMATGLEAEIEESQGLKREKLIRRAKLVKSLIVNNLRPEWMILTTVPIIPPDLRPMVALDGGRFATSDLNDLYRRVINRNNRLKQLLELKAPEVICRNEKRMLQEAIDALIDNSARHGKTVMASTGQKRTLKSLADLLKGKRGRFRQNLLGKRIDYSGRSVIVVGPQLKLHQCGLPKKMALELFKPFIISQLIKREIVFNVRSASRVIESGRDEVWDILEEIVKDSYVLLNRAPTLHRLGIQAFRPILIEGKAIQIHPLVCTAFNADFDGDQMAVHVPLSEEAKEEAATIMLASKNLLKPAAGSPIAMPNQDILWGAYHMSFVSSDEMAREENSLKRFADEHDAILAYSIKGIGLQERIMVRPSAQLAQKLTATTGEGRFVTTVGRIMFNQLFPTNIPFWNNMLDKKATSELVALSLEHNGIEPTAELLDEIKSMCFRYLTAAGLSFGMDDIPTLTTKAVPIKDAEDQIDEVQDQYDMGLLTSRERKSRVIAIWTETRDKVAKLSRAAITEKSSVFSIIESGARGNWTQLNQIIGMKGLLTNPSGEIIEVPIKSSFKEGLGVLEYFISTHGARKGLVDTALRTSNAGYLTRRLVDVAQDVVISELECTDTEGVVISKAECEAIDASYGDRLFGRTSVQQIKGADGTVIVKKNDMISRVQVKAILEAGKEEVHIRSVLACQSIRGICQACYGLDLAYNTPVKLGTAAGIIAAQSLGEPGTQLTMRTFHTGGVLGGDDITQGLPRVEELFEARIPKAKAVIAEVAGRVQVITKQRVTVDAVTGKELAKSTGGQKVVAVSFIETAEEVYKFTPAKKAAEPLAEGEEAAPVKRVPKTKVTVKVADGDKVMEGEVLFVTDEGLEVTARNGGIVKVEKAAVKIMAEVEGVQEYVVPAHSFVMVKDGDIVGLGDQLTEGSMDLQLLFKYKGKTDVQKYIINEIQRIYLSQGQKLNDKHIEIIVRQMFSRAYVTDAGQTDLLPGEVVERSEYLEANIAVADQADTTPAEVDELLMGITKASLSTRSWLSAASFQETARILINAAVTGKVDKLDGLKENVIIGRLIPVGTGYKATHH